MIVVITSWAPTVAFSRPAIPPQSAPASEARTIASRTWSRPGSPGSDDPTQTPVIAPTMYWPWPPMLKGPQRKANATARPVRMSGVVSSSVCWRLLAASEREAPVTQGKSQLRPVPSKIAR